MVKRVIMLVGVLVLAASLPALALAQVSAGGTGTVTATGDGSAGIRGAGDVSLSGNGTLLVIDRAGDATILVQGDGFRVERGSRILYRGFNGTATVSGSDFSVGLRGTGIELEATGTGAVRLIGTGTYTINGATGEWLPGEGVTLSLESAPAE